MGVTYVNPLEGMQKGFKTLGEGIGTYREKKQDRKRIEEILAGLDPETAKNFVGYTDPQKLGEAIVTNKRSLADDDRADKEFKFRQDEAEKKRLEDESKALDELYAKKRIPSEQYASAKNTINRKLGSSIVYEQNPDYDADAATKGGFGYKVQPLTVRPLLDVEDETYAKRKEIDNTYEEKKAVTNLKNNTTLEGTKHSNKIKEIKATTAGQKSVKGTPTFEEARKEKARQNKPKSNDDLIFEQINQRLKEKFGG